MAVMKIAALSLVLLIAVTAMVTAQPAIGWGPASTGTASFMGFPPSEFFQRVVLEKEAQKLLTTPNFPEDLKQRVQDTLAESTAGFDQCSAAAVGAMPWMQIRCTMQQVQKSKAALKAIEDEANARAAAAAAATTLTSL